MAVGVNIVSTFDSKGIDKAIRDFKKLEGTGNKAAFSLKTFDSAMTNGAKNLAKFGGAALIVGGIIGKSLITSASNLQESVSKINAVFGSAGNSVVAWSEKTAKALGISQRTALEAAGTYGNLFQAFGLSAPQAKEMSIRLVELAADMASFNNVPIDDALLALRSGLSGETEPLKRFGVALNEAALKNKALEMGLISNTKGTLPQAIKTQAAYALILEQTSLQQGDVARTSDGVAFKMKSFGAQVDDVKSQLGTALIPAFSALMSFLNDKIIPVFVEFADVLGKEGAGGAIKYLGGEILNSFSNMNKFGEMIFILIGAFVAIRAATIAYNIAFAVSNILLPIFSTSVVGATAAQTALNVAMKANTIGLIIAGIAAVVAIAIALYLRFEIVRKVINFVINFIIGLIENWLNAWITIINVIISGINLLIKAANFFGAGLTELGKIGEVSFGRIGQAADKAGAKIEALNMKYEGFGEKVKATKKEEEDPFKSFSSSASGAAKTVETAQQKLQKYIDALKGMSSAQKSARDADKSLLKSRTSLAEATLKLTDAQAYFNQVVAGYGANSKQAKDRQVALRKAQGDVEKAGYDVENSVFAVTEAEKELAEIRLDPEASAQAIRQAEINLAQAKLSVKDATESQIEATDDLAEAETLLDEAINGAKEGTDAFKDALDKLNDAKKMQADATDTVTEAIERQTEAVEKLREAEEKAQASRSGVNAADATAAEEKIGVKPKPSSSYASFLDAVKALHPNSKTLKSTTPVADSKAAFPKLFNDYKAGTLVALAQGGIVTSPTAALIGEAGAEAVIPLDKLNQGMTINLTINAGMGTDPAKLGDEIVDVLTRYQRRNGALPLKVA